MSVVSKLNVAIVGLGDIASKAYLPIVGSHPEIEPVLCTRNEERLREVGSRYRIGECYSDFDEALELKGTKKLDAVMIHSSTVSHYELVLKSLKAGVPVFVDKPISYHLDETRELIELAKEKQTLLYVGFNRRFCPLIQELNSLDEKTEVVWRKDRYKLPDIARTFVLDDFIHVVDSLRFLSKGSVEHLKVTSSKQKNLLHSVQIEWTHEGTLFKGSMNRMSDETCEQIEVTTSTEKWKIEELTRGTVYKEGVAIKSLDFDNWDSTLYKRGFQDMVDDFIIRVKEKQFDEKHLNDILESHVLCEKVLNEIGS